MVYQGCQDVFRTSFSIQERKKLLERFRLPEAYILNVGTIEQRKNVMLAVKAIKEVNIHLVVVGAKTAYYNDVKAYIQSHGLENKVTFLTGVSSKELAALYQSAQMFVYPSLFEGFGIPIIEALYSGIPVITSKGGCFKEAGGPASVYVDPSNEIELKEAIVNILEDEQLKQDMIVQGKQYVERFNPRYIADSFEKIYSELNKNLY
ncbi:glycosyltransferase family 4 protein [Geofilum rubicundum]|uniref:Glycosyltransferase n=1 Tax=Geofilum rubicundum JCM 15548 TaxID=1236989 RepID=A0A0E9LSK0_9BACT|nr:glycosyltransferase family 1 protein [Geofilum rubicundum]GAO28268.1 glycosyltransferase [Geofilum rubicundum JCM 15548]